MGVIIIDGNGNEIENTYKKRREEIKIDDYRPPEPQLEIIPIREEPRRIPYAHFIIPETAEKPLIDKDFGIYVPYKKIPRC